jgi:Basic region leucine zipper
MSGYQERAGPNVSQYLNNLNAISTQFDQDFAPDDFLDDLAMFTNTNFTDYDIPTLPDEFVAGTDSLEGFDTSPIDLNPSLPQPAYSTYSTPIQPAPAATRLVTKDDYASSIPASSAQPTLSRRRTESSSSPGLNTDEKSRLAAEEDKRRRNTAASARFRVKKKQREQTLEQTVKSVSEKNAKLEARVNQLEMENKWLKNLITEKNGNQSKEEIAEAYQKFRKESEERELKEIEQETTG